MTEYNKKKERKKNVFIYFLSPYREGSLGKSFEEVEEIKKKAKTNKKRQRNLYLQ